MSEYDDNDDNDEERPAAVVFIEQNVLKGRGFLNFQGRNLLEALVVVLVIIYIVMSINFTAQVKGFYILVFGGGAFYGVAKGYKNRSFTQIFIDYVRTVRNRKQLHLRGPEYVRQEIKLRNNGEADKSLAERIIEKGRQRKDEFVEQYAEKKDSD